MFGFILIVSFCYQDSDLVGILTSIFAELTLKLYYHGCILQAGSVVLSEQFGLEDYSLPHLKLFPWA